MLLSTVTVTTLDDVVNPADGILSLREAIAGAGVGDTIVFAKSLTRHGAAAIPLTGGALAIHTGLTIQGPGANRLAIDGNSASTVFYVADGAVTISGLSIVNGSADRGGGIFNQGTLIINGCDFDSNQAGEQGGAICNRWILTVCHSTFTQNVAGSFGGGIDSYNGTLTVQNCTFNGNSALYGGGVYSEDCADRGGQPVPPKHRLVRRRHQQQLWLLRNDQRYDHYGKSRRSTRRWHLQSCQSYVAQRGDDAEELRRQ